MKAVMHTFLMRQKYTKWSMRLSAENRHKRKGCHKDSHKTNKNVITVIISQYERKVNGDTITRTN